jgi:putative ABC transport system substrate-binding protein
MRRRQFIAGLGSAAALPAIARAQQGQRMRRVGVLAGALAQSDPLMQSFVAAFRGELAKFGWVEERNLHIDFRFGPNNLERNRTHAAELVRLAPDVIVAQTGGATRALQEQTQTIPIVVAGAGDVTSSGIVKNIAHPEGNVTGVTNLYSSIGSKWVELLKDVAPAVRRVANVLTENAQNLYGPEIQKAALALSIQTTELHYRNAVDVVPAIDAFAKEPNGGLIVSPPAAAPNREIIFKSATQHRLPTISFDAFFITEGALMTYGSYEVEIWRRDASFVDRILRGAEVSDLPVEFPTRFHFLINMKTAKAIGLEISPMLLAQADEVIE